MKKFDRLPPEKRKEEICIAATKIFNEKGFAATTMENIIEKVSLSKGGVYRIYPSTTAILSDIIIKGMHMRNRYYEECAGRAVSEGKEINAEFIIGMIFDSLTLYPEISYIYVEFLWEKQRNPELERLYREICSVTYEETGKLIKRYGAEDVFDSGNISMERITALMNSAILSIRVLGLSDMFIYDRQKICESILRLI